MVRKGSRVQISKAAPFFMLMKKAPLVCGAFASDGGCMKLVTGLSVFILAIGNIEAIVFLVGFAHDCVGGKISANYC